jgi:hypothetical protein
VKTCGAQRAFAVKRGEVWRDARDDCRAKRGDDTTGKLLELAFVLVRAGAGCLAAKLATFFSL